MLEMFVRLDVVGCMLGGRVGMNVVGIWMERMCVARRVCWSVGFCEAGYDAGGLDGSCAVYCGTRGWYGRG